MTFAEVHRIRTCGLSNFELAKEMGFSEYSIRTTRNGHRHPNHPTPPVLKPRGGWRKADRPCAFDAEAISLPGETWLPVVGWERHYRVSNLGRLYSLHQTGRFAIGMRVRGGYRVVKMRDGDRQACVMLHRMVLEAFIGPCPPGMETCHNNGRAFDNRLVNLRWDTKLANANDRKLHGTQRNRRAA